MAFGEWREYEHFYDSVSFLYVFNMDLIRCQLPPPLPHLQ